MYNFPIFGLQAKRKLIRTKSKRKTHTQTKNYVHFFTSKATRGAPSFSYSYYIQNSCGISRFAFMGKSKWTGISGNLLIFKMPIHYVIFKLPLGIYLEYVKGTSINQKYICSISWSSPTKTNGRDFCFNLSQPMFQSTCACLDVCIGTFQRYAPGEPTEYLTFACGGRGDSPGTKFVCK